MLDSMRPDYPAPGYLSRILGGQYPDTGENRETLPFLIARSRCDLYTSPHGLRKTHSAAGIRWIDRIQDNASNAGKFAMPKKPSTELIAASSGFNYAACDAKLAEKLRVTADEIRQRLKKTLESTIEIGEALLAVKDALEHGQFLAWLRAEFSWRERTARNFMSVAEHFGKSAKFADLTIQPSAAYLLAAPSTPDEVREAAVKKAESGEEITWKVAKQMLAKAKEKGRKRKARGAAKTIGDRLGKALERYRQQWNQKELAELAKQLREFADELEKAEQDRKN